MWINTHNFGDPALPFGGYKQSGWGREMGFEAIELYTEVKAVAAALLYAVARSINLKEQTMAMPQTIENLPPSVHWQAPIKRMLIDGEWVRAASGKTFESRNPATGELLAMVAEGDKEDIDRAVAAARRAFEGPWSKFKPYERQALLLKLADLVEKNFDELSRSTRSTWARRSRARATTSSGRSACCAGTPAWRPRSTARRSRTRCRARFLLHLEGAGRRRRRDHPVERPARRLHLEDRPGAGHRLHRGAEAGRGSAADPAAARRALLDAGVPPGVVNVVPGYGETAGAALAAHPGVDKVAFTGSHLTGQSIVRASAGNLKRVSLELGGKSPDIVFADADLETAVPGAGMAVFANSGQICSAGTRLFVESKVYDEFIGRVADFGKALKVGNGLDPDTQIGPLVSEQQLERVTGYLETGRQEGARPLTGGQPLTDGAYAKGYFVPPTVFADVNDDMRIAQEEIFGPVISAIPFTDIEEVIQPRQRHQLRPRQRRVDARRVARRIAWPRGCAPARCGSTATRRWTRQCRSAATR